MVKSLSRPLALSVAAALLTVAVDPVAAGEPRIVGLRVVGSSYGESDFGPELRPFNWQEGTTLSVLLTADEGAIIAIKEDECTVSKMQDSTGQSLVSTTSDFGRPGTRVESSDVSSDGQAAILEITTNKRPAAGANSVSVDATVKMVTASKKATRTSDTFALKEGERVTVGDLTFTVQSVGPPDFGDGEFAVVLRNKTSVDAVAGWTLLKPDGSPLKTDTGSTMVMGFSGNVTTDKELILDQKVSSAKLSLDVWTDRKETDVPVSAEVSVGL